MFQLLATLCRCPGCGNAPVPESFPLCAGCHGSLLPCPPLCQRCASPACPAFGTQCLRPWAADPAVRSYTALYLLTGQGYRVLRQWKKRRGPLFDRRILVPVHLPESARALWLERRRFSIVPLPQSARRSWQLGGSPAEAAALWLARETSMPLVRALRAASGPLPGPAGALRQAERPLGERLLNRIRLEVDRPPGWRPDRHPVVLVDDFLTSGHTVRSAARALNGAGVREVHVFCLGLRPLRSGSLDPEKCRNLLKSG